MKKILVILVAFFSCFDVQNTFAVDEDAQAQYEKYMEQINAAYEKAMQRFQKECERDTTKKWTGEECVDKTKKDIRQEKRNNKKGCESNPANTWVNGECKTKEDVCNADETTVWLDNKCVKKDKIAKQQKKDKDKDEANQKKLCEKDGKHKYDDTGCNKKTPTELCDDQKGIMVDGNCITKKSCESDGEHTWDAKTKTCNDKEKSKLQQRKETKGKTESNGNEKTKKDIRQEQRAKKADEREKAKQKKEKQKADNKTQRQEQRDKKADERKQAKQEKQCEKQDGYIDNNGNCITKEICEQDGNKTFTGSDCIEKPQETPPAPANTDDKAPEQNTPVETPKNENNVSGSAAPVAQPEKEEKSTVADTTTKIKLSAQDATLEPDSGFAKYLNNNCAQLSNGLWQSKNCNSTQLAPGEYEVTFSYGKVKGTSKCYAEGQYANVNECLCKLETFTGKNGETQNLNYDWYATTTRYYRLVGGAISSDKVCANTCTDDCLIFWAEPKGENNAPKWRKDILKGIQPDYYYSYKDFYDRAPIDLKEINGKASSKSRNTSTEPEIIQVESSANSWKAIGGGIELDGSCAVQYDTGMIDASKKSSCDKLKLKSPGQWEFKSDKHGLIKGSAKCESETCFCQINMINNNYTSTTWVKKNMFDDYTDKDRENKNCQNSCVYSCMYGLETDSDYQNRLFNNKVQKLSEANPAKAGKTFKALSKENFCYASRVTADNKLAQINEKKQCSALKKEQWVVDFDYGTVKGTSMCLNTKGDTKGFKKIINSATEKPGDFCWCQITQFTPTDGTLQNINAYSVYLGTNNISCSSECARQCGFNLLGKPDWRKIILNSELD